MDGIDDVRPYLARLPHGTASYPNCVARAFAYEELRQELPPLDGPTVSEVLSPTLSTYLRQGMTDTWMPEVWASIVLELWFATVAGRDEARFREKLRAVNQDLFDSVLFRAVLRVLSPSLVILGVARTWRIARRGSDARAIMGPRHESPRTATVEVRHPPWLFGERQLIAFEEAIGAVADTLAVKHCLVRRTKSEVDATTFGVEWRERRGTS